MLSSSKIFLLESCQVGLIMQWLVIWEAKYLKLQHLILSEELQSPVTFSSKSEKIITFFRATLNDKKQIVYASALTFGFPSELVIESECHRGLFGQYRYAIHGAKKFLANWSLKSYQSQI